MQMEKGPQPRDESRLNQLTSLNRAEGAPVFEPVPRRAQSASQCSKPFHDVGDIIEW